MEYEKTKSSHLQKSRQLEELRAKSSNNQLEIRRLEATILDLQEIQSDDENENIVVVKKDIQQLMGAIAEWKKTWLLIAPIDGKVELTSAWSEQQYVKAGDEILTVVPQQASTALFTKAFLTGNSIGKVEPGMEVQIRLASFPYQEYGFLEGKIERIADVRTKDGYEARIQLNKGLVTSHKKTLEFKQEMSGIAKIITKDRNLLIRILEKIKVAFEK